jgi:transcriptional regulator with XRE-family HTH domain
MKTIGSKIKSFRDAQKLSQTELATKLGIGQTTLGDIESGSTKKIDNLLMFKICKEFKVELDYFINDEQANKVKTNQDQLDIDLTICGENIIEQIKTLVEDYKQKDLRIKVLEEYILSLQKQIE